MSTKTELINLENAIYNLAYLELKVTIPRPRVPKNFISIPTVEAYDSIKTLAAQSSMDEYLSTRQRLAEENYNKLTVGSKPAGATDINTKELTSPGTLNIGAAELQKLASIAGNLVVTNISFGPTIYGAARYSNGGLFYIVEQYRGGWEKIIFQMTHQLGTVSGFFYIKLTLPPLTPELVPYFTGPEYIKDKSNLDKWVEDLTRSDVLTWMKNKKVKIRESKFGTIKYEYPKAADDLLKGKNNTLIVQDQFLLDWNDQSFLYYKVYGDPEYKYFKIPNPPEFIPEVSDSPVIDYSLLSSDVRHQPVHFPTSNYSGLATSSVENSLSRASVDISVELLTAGIDPNLTYWYKVTLTNTRYNAVINNIRISPVKTVDNKNRNFEVFLDRSVYIKLNGKSYYNQLRRDILEDLRRVLLVH